MVTTSTSGRASTDKGKPRFGGVFNFCRLSFSSASQRVLQSAISVERKGSLNRGPAMTFWKWSRTAASNGTADSSINFAEGQAPSSLNDAGRGVMAAAAKFRDDISGAIATTGTSTAYTVSSYQGFDTLAHLDGQMIAFTPHATNTAGSPNVTLNVDGLGAKSIQANPGVELPAGFLVAGSPYVALYSATSGVFYLQNSFANPYNIPVGASVDFWGSTAPNSSFALMYGQAISRTTYSALFSLFSTTYGSGDGTTTFNIPDLRGRVVAGKDDMGGSAASRLTATYFGTSAASLGAAGGAESKVLITANLPPYTPAGTISAGIASLSLSMRSASSSGSDVVDSVSAGNSAGTSRGIQAQSSPSGTVTGTLVGTAQGGTSTPVAIAQPTIIGNKLLRLI